MSQFHFDPGTYPALIRDEVPAYDELQRRLADATADVECARILDLGAGTGATSAELRRVHPAARLVAVDESAAMLAFLEDANAETRVARLQDPLPAGPFDVVASALAVHHLDGAEKRELFARVRGADDQVEWLRDAGFDAALLWTADDLALISADAA